MIPPKLVSSKIHKTSRKQYQHFFISLNFLFCAQHSILSVGIILLLFFGAGCRCHCCSFYTNQQGPKANQHEHGNLPQQELVLLGPCRLVLGPCPPLMLLFPAPLIACSCLNNFRDGERASCSSVAGYKMSISSNNAIDKLRQPPTLHRNAELRQQ